MLQKTSKHFVRVAICAGIGLVALEELFAQLQGARGREGLIFIAKCIMKEWLFGALLKNGSVLGVLALFAEMLGFSAFLLMGFAKSIEK